MPANFRTWEVNYLRNAIQAFYAGSLVACCPFVALLQAVQVVIGSNFLKLLIET
jgi:hypothetical protein